MRASSLDRLLACTASQEAPTGPRVGSPDDAARTGTAVHELMRAVVTGQESSVYEIAERYHVDPDEVAMLRALARQLWERVATGFPDPVCEAELHEENYANEMNVGDMLLLTGHPDVMSCVEGEVRIGDWKTGFNEAACDNQLRAYAYLGILYYRSQGIQADCAYVAQLRVRTREIIGQRYTWDQLKRWYAGAVNRLQSDPTFSPSPEACRYCPRRLECPGRNAMMRSEASVICDMEMSETLALTNMTPEQLRHGVTSARALKDLCEKFLDAAKTEVTIRGGELPGLVVVQQERREIAPEAWPLLEQRLGLPVLSSIAKIPKGKVEDAIKETAAPRRKGAEVREFMDELEAAGVLNVEVTEKLEVRPVPNVIEDAIS